MKLFKTLSDIHKERAIHMCEHMILENLMSDNFEVLPETQEEKDNLAQIQEAIAHAKTLDKPEEQAEFLIATQVTGDLVFEKAYQLATTAFYIEKNEVAFNLDELDFHFDDADTENSEPEVDEKLPEITVKKDTSHLN